MYIKGKDQSYDAWYLGKGAKLYRIIQLNYKEVRTHEVVKQPGHGRASTTQQQKCPSFQTNYD